MFCNVTLATSKIPGFWDYPYTPVVPQFYWDVESQEQRTKYLCQLFDKLVHYVEDVSAEISPTSDAIKELQEQFQKFMESGFDDYYAEQIAQWVDDNMPDIISRAIKMVFFGLTDDGYFCAYVPDSWSEIEFDTGAVYGTPEYGRLILEFEASNALKD